MKLDKLSPRKYGLFSDTMGTFFTYDQDFFHIRSGLFLHTIGTFFTYDRDFFYIRSGLFSWVNECSYFCGGSNYDSLKVALLSQSIRWSFIWSHFYSRVRSILPDFFQVSNLKNLRFHKFVSGGSNYDSLKVAILGHFFVIFSKCQIWNNSRVRSNFQNFF